MKILATTLTFALLIAGVALAAATNTYKVETSVSPNKAGSKKKPVPIGQTTITTVGEASGQRPAVVEYYKYKTTGIRINSKAFPTCAASRIESSGSSSGCPKGSQVGSATATVISGVTEQQADQTYNCSLENKIFNAPKGHVAIHITADPAKCDGNVVNNVIDGVWKNRKSGAIFSYDVPAEQNHSVAGISSATTFNKSVYKRVTRKYKGKKVGYMEAIGCKGGKRTTTVTFRTEEGQTGKATTSSSC